jgi:acyl carrier protein
MNKQEIRRVARETVAEILELESEEVHDASDFELDLGGDSVQRLELIMALESRFGIRYPLEESSQMNSVEDIIRVTQNSLAR